MLGDADKGKGLTFARGIEHHAIEDRTAAAAHLEISDANHMAGHVAGCFHRCSRRRASADSGNDMAR